MLRTSVIVTLATSATLLLAGCSSDNSTSDASATVTPTPTATTTTGATSTPTAPITTTAPTATPTAPTTPAASPTASAAPNRGTFIDYEKTNDTGVILSQEADASQLTGAPADFRKFITAELANTQAHPEKGCPEKAQLYVARLATGGWASGGYFVPQCGGYAALWAKSGGSWKQAWSGQELVSCTTLTQYNFPASVAGSSCLKGDKTVPYTAK